VTLLAFAPWRTRAIAFATATAALALAGGILVATYPEIGLVAVGLLALAVVGAFVPTRYVVGALLVYLPLQDLVISRAPGSLVVPARYLPELIVYAIAFLLVLTRITAAGRGVRLFVAVAAVIVLWSLTGFWNDVAPSTIAAGARSEFRFLPLALVAMLSLRVREDARFYARVLLAVACAQAVIALLEAVGGESIRAIFAPEYELVVRGTVVDRVGPPLDTIFGTFSHRNILGAFLAFAGIVLASASPKELGLRGRTAILLWLLLAAGTLAAVSREGMIALIIGTVFALSFQHRLPAKRLLFIIGTAAVLATLAIRPQSDTPAHHGLSSWSRWNDVVSSRGWSATPSGNFRLYYLLSSVEFVAHDAPFAGFGLGTVSDPRAVQSGSSPLESYPAGRLAVRNSFYNDGNWTVLLLETGFGGILLLALLLTLLARTGRKVALAGFWAGAALAGLVLATVILGFFAPVLQTRSASFVLWLFAGLAAAGSIADRTARPAEQAAVVFPRRAHD
jgi:hypothetical protein